MAKIEATSKTKFKQSGKVQPSGQALFIARTKKEVKVRTWAGKTNPEAKFSPIPKGAVAIVCDAILSKAGNTWYYIKYNGKYGFAYYGHFQSVSKNALKFVEHLNEFHDYVKQHGDKFIYKFESELDSFEKMKARIKSGKKAGMTCLVPMALALRVMGIKRADGKIWVSGNDGSFKQHYTGGVKKYFARITDGKMIGLTVEDAVNRNLLKPGDMIAYKDKTHTSCYTGKDYIMFDGGHNSMKNGKHTGIKANYENYPYKISEILRWKE